MKGDLNMDKITIEDYRNMIEGKFDKFIDAEWNGVTLHIKRTLSLREMASFVEYIVGSCFTEDLNEYLPEVKDFAIRCCILEIYGNLTLPESIDERYEIAYDSDITDFIIGHIDQSQFRVMLIAIDEKIKHRAQNSIEALNKQMSDVFAGLSSVEKVVSEIFDDVDSDTIQKLAGAIADGGFDERKLIEAFKSGTGE